MAETTVSVAVARPNDDADVTAAVPAAASKLRLALWSTWKTSRNAQRRGTPVAKMHPPLCCAGLLRRGNFIDAYVETPRDFDVS